MPRFSANLGFLWSELSLPDAIRASKAAGFEAVECHWPYAVEAMAVKDALSETGLDMLGLNTQRGDVAAGENGVAAIPGREAQARLYIDEAIAYARAIGCGAVHVMPGKTDRSAEAEAVFQQNLVYASDQAPELTFLLEPLNSRDVPGYHLTDMDHACATIDAIGRANIKAMFDCYHIQIMQGDLSKRIEACLPYIGHIQVAAVPDRGEPDAGEVNYPAVLQVIDDLGWNGFVGAEYKPRNGTDAGLGWMDAYR